MLPRQHIVKTGRLIENRGYIRAASGNISVRLDENRILITPGGKAKGSLSGKDLLVISLDGHILSGAGVPSSETAMHLCAYRLRPDVKAAIHAHPPYATALTLSGFDLSQDILPEIFLTIGKIHVARYATPCTTEDAYAIRGPITKGDVIMLPRHGSLTVGKTLKEALFKLELLEHAAKIIYLARTIGKVEPLSEGQIKKLAKVKG